MGASNNTQPIQSQTTPQPVQPITPPQQMAQAPQQAPQQMPSWFTGNGGGFSGMPSTAAPAIGSSGFSGMQSPSMNMQAPDMSGGVKQSPQFSGCGHDGGQVMPQTLFRM